MRPVDPLLVHVVWRAHPQRFKRRGLTTETNKLCAKCKHSNAVQYMDGGYSFTFKTMDEECYHPSSKGPMSCQKKSSRAPNTYTYVVYISCWISEETQKNIEPTIKLHHFDYFIHSQHDYSMPPETNPVLNQISPAWNIMVFIYLFCLFQSPYKAQYGQALLGVLDLTMVQNRRAHCANPGTGHCACFTSCLEILACSNSSQSPQWPQWHHGLYLACSVIL
jgi:hypothetical protein